MAGLRGRAAARTGEGARRSGRNVTIGLARLPAQDQAGKKGVLLVDTGGPGEQIALLRHGGAIDYAVPAPDEGTVKIHVASPLRTLGPPTRVHAVVYAYEHGLAPRSAARSSRRFHMPLIRRRASRHGRGWWIAGTLTAVLLAVAVVVTTIAFPSVAATTCPGCYGLQRLRSGLYAEPGLAPAQRRHVAEVVEQANQRVRDFFGGRASAPDVLVCLTDDCYRRIGGGRERGIAVLNRSVMLSPRGVDPVIASHELTHVELHVRLDGAEVPQWFDEGLAVLVSDDPRYLAPAGDRCLLDSRRPLPVTLGDWLRAASADHRVYAEAACQVSRWAGTNGGKQAVLTLVERLSAGHAFRLHR
ncbi:MULTISPECIES: hypothetical protein [unclassified Nonomuraea]|uniref:hypothetical protein n=1 Tax=unclassified Nonomuraea TaxID=2593643 RepID=UPI00191C5499|nr:MULTISPECIES: hypothetical protein [unclassified Nonomuraea]